MTNKVDMKKVMLEYDLPHKHYYSKGTAGVAFTDENSGFQYFFSYETLVAFHHTNSGLVVRENIWGNTTGRHLNDIDGGSVEAVAKRVAYIEDFTKALQKAQTAQRKTVVAVAKIVQDDKDREMRNKALADRIRLNNGYSKAGH